MTEIVTTGVYGNFPTRVKFDGSITWIAMDEMGGDPEEIIKDHLKYMVVKNEDVTPFAGMYGREGYLNHGPKTRWTMEYGPGEDEDQWAMDAIMIDLYLDGRVVITKAW